MRRLIKSLNIERIRKPFRKVECAKKRTPGESCVTRFSGHMYYSFFNSSMETRNPNAVLIGTKFGFLNCGGRYKTRIRDIACYIVLKYIKIALFASFDELFCPVLSLLLPTCVNLLRLKISKTFGRYIPLTSRVRRTPYSATKTTAVHRRILICQSIITEVNSSINRQSFLYIIFGVFPAYFPA